MSIYKVKINKDRTGKGTKYNYPSDYNPEIFSPFIYENKGNKVEYCLAFGEKGLEATGIELIDKTTSEKLIDDWVNNNKDFAMPDNIKSTESEYKTELANEKKALL